MILIKNLRKVYNNHTALHIPYLDISSAQSFGLVGNNGAGKTTLFRCILDLLEATEGEVISGEKAVALSDHWKNYTGSYLDEGFLIPFLTPIEYFRFVADTYNIPKEQLNHLLEPYEAFLSLETLQSKKYIRDLSVGNKHKVGIVAALMVKPKVIVLDEPFANLDPSSQLRLKKILFDLKNEHHTTMLISSHDLSYLYEISDRIVILEAGEIKSDLLTGQISLQELEKHFAVE